MTTANNEREERRARNDRLIEEFRANAGAVGDNWAGRPLLLISTKGAKSGKPHTNPVMFMKDGDRWLVFATRGGAPYSPDWYHNLVANPVVTVEVGADTFEADTTTLTGEERDRLYAKQAAEYPQFGEYEKKTTRVIPVVALTRRG